ncbi:hypothetical protein L873DRAFT_292395 [Choiromyces venosus 120613-1]|uniref:Uncharacterized protein n=1 Tax=Choiromyces venosus 120613-1 TaxID=1336337 RepID=A0A3N4J055_9PEZI|nr:hypothetical protein L873DRAFT_292395 [Choiromyces venosus 120613-1]
MTPPATTVPAYVITPCHRVNRPRSKLNFWAHLPAVPALTQEPHYYNQDYRISLPLLPNELILRIADKLEEEYLQQVISLTHKSAPLKPPQLLPHRQNIRGKIRAVRRAANLLGRCAQQRRASQVSRGKGILTFTGEPTRLHDAVRTQSTTVVETLL